MKTLIIALSATAAMGLALVAPASAEAGQVQLNVQIGVPLFAYPHVVYRPAPVYQSRVVYRRAPWYRHAHYYRPAPHRGFDHYRRAAPVYHQGFAAPRKIEEIRINPRLQY